MTHEQYEVLSNQAVAACAVVYFLALLAHLAQWAAARSVEPAVAVEPVAVGGGAQAPGSPVADDPADDPAEESERIELFGRIGVALTVVAPSVQLVAVVVPRPRRRPGAGALGQHVRVHADRHLGRRRSSTWLLYQRYSLSWLGPIVTGFVLVTLMLDVLRLYTPVVPLRDALQSPWLVIHVVAAIIATGAFTVGGMCSALFLVKERWEEKQAGRSEPARRGYLARLPEPRGARPDRLPRARVRLPDLDLRGADRRADLGALRLGLATGAGTPRRCGPSSPGWCTPPTCTPARPPGWKGRSAAIVALVGFATLLFNFVGINFFFGSGSQHSYAAPALAPWSALVSRSGTASVGQLDFVLALTVACAGACARARAGSPRRRRARRGRVGRACRRTAVLQPPCACAPLEQPEERVEHRGEEGEEDDEPEHVVTA